MGVLGYLKGDALKAYLIDVLITLDEAPDAYKDKADIVRLIEPTAKVLFTLYPKMNIKAAEGKPAWAK